MLSDSPRVKSRLSHIIQVFGKSLQEVLLWHNKLDVIFRSRNLATGLGHWSVSRTRQLLRNPPRTRRGACPCHKLLFKLLFELLIARRTDFSQSSELALSRDVSKGLWTNFGKG